MSEKLTEDKAPAPPGTDARLVWVLYVIALLLAFTAVAIIAE